MDSVSPKKFIEHIRREQFGIGTGISNPLARMLHEAIVHLSAELYEKDIHFISELLQNAEDNLYGREVSPSLEMVVTEEDIAKVGATATLILFNNEDGFQPQHIKALCAVGLSTKKGKRDSGYIGEKGIGFKSVFLVTRTPYIISNGYRFRFTDEASQEANIGYVVPEWTDTPTDADLRRVYGKPNLPQTMIILPLRPDKIEPVREQLKEVSPETLLFLSKLRQLVVRAGSQNNLCITRSDISPATKDGERCKVATMNLSVGSSVTHVSEQCTYQLLQHRIPVTHSVEQRREVENWEITLAFPLLERINPGRLTGDIYSFLPSYLSSGFPFVINADFLLVSSRATLKFDSPWNIGILSCIPSLFISAFKLFLQTSRGQVTALPLAVREAYRYIPIGQPQNIALQKVQEQILTLLRHEDCVLVDRVVATTSAGSTVGVGCNLFCKPEMARLIPPEFRRILEAANAESNLNSYLQWYVVDHGVQESYTKNLEALGVKDMTEAEYIECLSHDDWLLSLSEELYWEVVFFILDYCCRASGTTSMRTVPILKYLRKDGSTALASIEEAQSPDGVKIYLSALERGGWLSQWTSAFKRWVSIQFMPTETVRVLKKWKEESSPKITKQSWNYLLEVVPDLSVKNFLLQVLPLLSAARDPKFILLTTEFAYKCVQLGDKDIGISDVRVNYPRHVPVVNQSGSISWIARDHRYNDTVILLPAHGSSWPQLSLDSWSSKLVVMSDDYATASAEGDGLELEPYRAYLRKVVGACDILDIIPPDSALYSISTNLSSNMTVEQAGFLLLWLTTFLNSRRTVTKSPFFQRLKASSWLPTEGHGRRQPSSCFEKRSFSAFFKASDLPFVHPHLTPFQSTLGELDVTINIDKGCAAVVNYMSEMSSDTTHTRFSCDLEQATRFYRYLQKFLWKPDDNSRKLKIFVPGAEANSSNEWQQSECCVLHKDDGFFDNTLTVLEELYPGSLLRFFNEVLQVPRQATVERYCELWLKWRSDVHEITADECTRVWKILSEKRENCDDKVWREFVAKAWVPSQCDVTGACQLSSPSACLIPDDLDLLSLFSTSVQFVWYPCNTEQMECAMNEIYVEMGVKKLTECVQADFINVSKDSSGREVFIENRRVQQAGNGILCPGLFRAILGFSARKKYGLSSSKRQSILVSLKGVSEITITRPLTRRYQISRISAPVTVTKDNVMALWSKTDKKLYLLDIDGKTILGDSLATRDFRVQVATTISLGLFSEHPLIADDLTEFIIGLLACKFEPSQVDYELRRKNAKLYEEDESFLSEVMQM